MDNSKTHRTGGRIVEFHVHEIDARSAVQIDFHTFDFCAAQLRGQGVHLDLFLFDISSAPSISSRLGSYSCWPC
jgi:hypothetical protein